MSQLLRKYSIEITPKLNDKIPQIAQNMPNGADVYIAMINQDDTTEQAKTAAKLKKHNLNPIPHITARFVRNENDLEHILKIYKNEAGVSHMLVIGGSAEKPIGKFDAAIQLLKTGLFEKYNITHIALAGHPEGNIYIKKDNPQDTSIEMNALKEKHDYIQKNGAQGFITTQLLFEAAPIKKWLAELKDNHINMPVHIGVAGPATIKSLARYAQLCGVGASAKFILKQARNITKLLTVSTPDQYIDDLTHITDQNPNLNLHGLHFYPFGGIDRLFEWMQARQ